MQFITAVYSPDRWEYENTAKSAVIRVLSSVTKKSLVVHFDNNTHLKQKNFYTALNKCVDIIIPVIVINRLSMRLKVIW